MSEEVAILCCMYLNKIFACLIQILLLIASPLEQFSRQELGVCKLFQMLNGARVL